MKKGIGDLRWALILSVVMFFFGFLFGQRWASSPTPSPAAHPRVRMELVEEIKGIEEGTLTFYKILEGAKRKPPRKEEKGKVKNRKEGKRKEKDRNIETHQGDRYSVQVSSYRTKAQALSHLDELKREGYRSLYITVVEIDGKGRWFRLRSGPFDNKEKAQKTAEQMIKKSGRNVFVVKLD